MIRETLRNDELGVNWKKIFSTATPLELAVDVPTIGFALIGTVRTGCNDAASHGSIGAKIPHTARSRRRMNDRLGERRRSIHGITFVPKTILVL